LLVALRVRHSREGWGRHFAETSRARPIELLLRCRLDYLATGSALDLQHLPVFSPLVEMVGPMELSTAIQQRFRMPSVFRRLLGRFTQRCPLIQSMREAIED
jgi:hypothetical protein